VQYKGRWLVSSQGKQHRVQMLGAFSQHQDLAALFEGRFDLGGDGFGPRYVVREVPEHILNASGG
jgi:hypothetical protein